MTFPNGKDPTPLDDLVQGQLDEEENARVAAMERERDFPEEWIPLSVFGQARIVGTPPCPPGLLPEAVEAYAYDVAERLGVDTAMVFMPMLAACAAAVDDRAMVRPLRYDSSWRESARVWVAFVAESGEKKTPAMKAALQPLYALEREWAREDSERHAQYQEERKLLDEAKKLQQKAAAKALATGKTLEAPELPAPPRMPPIRRKVVSDTTIEALSDLLSKVDWGVLEVHDELSGWFGNFDAYRVKANGKDRSLYLEAYNGGPQVIDRVSRGRVYVPNWSLSLVGGIQPEPMKRLAGQTTDDGLIQRFMVVFTHRGSMTVDREPNEELHARYERIIRQLATWDIGGPEAIRLFSLSEGAQEYRELINARVQQIRTMPWITPAFHAHLAKWEGLFPRLVLLWHLIQNAENLYHVCDEIQTGTAQRVAAFMLDYLLPHAARFYTELLQKTDEDSEIQWIAGHILAHNLQAVSIRDVGRAFRSLRGKTKEIQLVMEHLTALAWVKPSNDHKAGGATRWKVNPLVHSLFASRAQEERLRRQATIEKIQETVSQFPELGAP